MMLINNDDDDLAHTIICATLIGETEYLGSYGSNRNVYD